MHLTCSLERGDTGRPGVGRRRLLCNWTLTFLVYFMCALGAYALYISCRPCTYFTFRSFYVFYMHASLSICSLCNLSVRWDWFMHASHYVCILRAIYVFYTYRIMLLLMCVSYLPLTVFSHRHNAPLLLHAAPSNLPQLSVPTTMVP